MKNTIIVASAVLLIIVGLFLWGKVGSSRSANFAILATGSMAAAITDAISVYDFGLVSMLKGNVEHEFAIQNTTAAEVTVTQVETSCMCTRAIIKLPDGKEMGPFGMPGHGFVPSVNAVIRPGEKIMVRAIFDPAAHGPAGIGKIERAVTLTTNNGPILMQFKAEVAP